MDDLNLVAKWYYIDENNRKNIAGPFSSSEMIVRYNNGALRKEYMIKTKEDTKFFSYETCYTLCGGKSPFIEQFTSIEQLINKRILTGQPVSDNMQFYASKPLPDLSPTSSSNVQMEKIQKNMKQLEVDNLALRDQCKKVITDRDDAKKKIICLEKDLREKDEQLKKELYKNEHGRNESEIKNQLNLAKNELNEMRIKKEEAERKTNTCVEILKSHVHSITQMKDDLDNATKENHEMKIKIQMLESQVNFDENHEAHSNLLEQRISQLTAYLDEERKKLVEMEIAYKKCLVQNSALQQAAHSEAEFKRLQDQLKEEIEKRNMAEIVVKNLTLHIKKLESQLENSSAKQILMDLMRFDYKNEWNKNSRKVAESSPGHSKEVSSAMNGRIETVAKPKPTATIEEEVEKFLKAGNKANRPTSPSPSNLESSICNSNSHFLAPLSPEILVMDSTPTRAIPLSTKLNSPKSALSNLTDLPEPSRGRSKKKTEKYQKTKKKHEKSGKSKDNEKDKPSTSKKSGLKKSPPDEVIQYGDLLIDLSKNMRVYYEEICDALERGVIEPCVFYLQHRYCKFGKDCIHLHDDKMTSGVQKMLHTMKKTKARPTNMTWSGNWSKIEKSPQRGGNFRNIRNRIKTRGRGFAKNNRFNSHDSFIQHDNRRFSPSTQGQSLSPNRPTTPSRIGTSNRQHDNRAWTPSFSRTSYQEGYSPNFRATTPGNRTPSRPKFDKSRSRTPVERQHRYSDHTHQDNPHRSRSTSANDRYDRTPGKRRSWRESVSPPKKYRYN